MMEHLFTSAVITEDNRRNKAPDEEAKFVAKLCEFSALVEEHHDPPPPWGCIHPIGWKPVV